MLKIDEQVSRMLDLVVDRKLKLNKLGKTRCLDNEEDEEDKKYIEKLEQTYKLEECCCIE